MHLRKKRFFKIIKLFLLSFFISFLFLHNNFFVNAAAKQQLSTFTKSTTETITVTQAETINKTQATLNKFLKQDGSLTINTDVTITFNANDNKKATLTATANSKAQSGSSVVFNNVTVEKPQLSTKLTVKELGALDARTQDAVKAAVLSTNANNLTQVDKTKFTITLDTDATQNKATVTHPNFDGDVVVTFSIKEALDKKLTITQLGALDARTQAAIKDAVLTKNTDLKTVEQNKFTITLDTDATQNKAKVKHSDFTGEEEVRCFVFLDNFLF
ncbi:putative secreted protein [Candidatus Phytoplasma solani]